MHNTFTVFLRKYPSGKKVFFYYTYDEDGQRRGPWTTKSKTKTEARNYCHSLIKKGALIPDRKKTLTFGEFATGFWEKESEYVAYRNSRTDITESYISTCRSITENQLIPFFGKEPIDKITAADVNKWLLGFGKREVKQNGEKKVIEYTNNYANSVFRTFKTMMSEAVRRGHLADNPCLKVQRLKNDRKEITLITIEEVRRLFPADFKTVWGDRETAYAANKLASLTGMRAGEILGLRGEYVFDNYIHVCGQYGPFGYLPHTKTKENRNIPLLPEMIGLLRELMKHNGNGFVFSLDGGATPVSRNNLYTGLQTALGKIGIDQKEMRRRGLTLHAWRHFVNTDFQRQGLTIQQVQGVTGHKSERMTEWYSHLDPRMIDDVVKAQAVIAGTDQPEEGKTADNFNGLKIVKTDRIADTALKGA